MILLVTYIHGRIFSIISAVLIFFQHPSTYIGDRAYIGDCAYIFSTNTSIQSKTKYTLDIMHAALISTKTVLIIETELIMFRKVLTVC